MLDASSKNVAWSAGHRSLTSALVVFGIGVKFIRKKLDSIQALFPHNDTSLVPNIAEIYHDALDFLRFRCSRRDSVKRTVVDCLLAQIRSQQTYHLIGALRERPQQDVQDFFSQIFSVCMNDLEKLYDDLHQRGRNAVLTPASQEARTLLSVLLMTGQMTKKNSSMCQAVMEANVLDLLLRIYIIFPAFSHSAIDGAEPWLTLLDACRENLQNVIDSYTDQRVIMEHPLCTLWIDCSAFTASCITPVRGSDQSLSRRTTAWRKAPQTCVERRIRMIYINTLWKSNADTSENVEACRDILEFTRAEFYEPETVQMAFLAMLRCIFSGGDHVMDLVIAIAQESYHDIVRVFSGTIRLWLEAAAMHVLSEHNPEEADPLGSLNNLGHLFMTCTAPPTPTPSTETFYHIKRNTLFRKAAGVDSTLYNTIKFYVKASQHNVIMSHALFAAGALSLVLVAFMNPEFRPLGLGEVVPERTRRLQDVDTDYPSTIPVPLGVIHDDASTLTVLMHTPAFRASWPDGPFRLRRALCSRLVNGLLSSGAEMNDGYAWTRALFHKMLA